MPDIIKLLIKQNKTISTMESCTGGGLANALTNIEHSSEVFKFGAVTYSNDFKIKMGVKKDIIEKYTVYSMEVAKEMSKTIATFTNSNYGIGITGQLKRKDPYNNTLEDDKVYISLYDKDNNKYVNRIYICEYDTRKENKDAVINIVKDLLNEILND